MQDMEIMDKYLEKLYQSRILSAIIFFGLAGLIWGGWDLYASEPPATYPLTIIGAILIGFFGGIGLALPITRNMTQIGKIIGFGVLGCVLGFVAAWLGIYNLSILGSSIIAFFPIPASTADFFGLDRMPISAYWLNFALAGAFIGLFFAIGLKEKILNMALRGAVGFGLAAIAGPILGNFIGNLFNAMLTAYLFTFLIIGVVLGLSLSFRINKKEKEGSGPA